MDKGRQFFLAIVVFVVIAFIIFVFIQDFWLKTVFFVLDFGALLKVLYEMFRPPERKKTKKDRVRQTDIVAELEMDMDGTVRRNIVAGKKLFQEMQCTICHEVRNVAEDKKAGPNLAKLKGVVSPIYMATALWNHGPKMIGRMKEKNIKWRKVTDKDLINLMAYFNQGD